MTDLRLVLKSLTARSTSTVVTCLLIAIAVALLLSMRSLREAGRESFTRGGRWGIVTRAQCSHIERSTAAGRLARRGVVDFDV